MEENKKLNLIAMALGFSGFGAGALSVSEIATVLGAITGFISALSVSYQVITNAKAGNELTLAQARKIDAETKKANAEAEKAEIENDKLLNQCDKCNNNEKS